MGSCGHHLIRVPVPTFFALSTAPAAPFAHALQLLAIRQYCPGRAVALSAAGLYTLSFTLR